MNMPDLTQMTAAQIFSSAVAAHQAGDRERAEALYKRVLQANPKDDQAQYLLGALFYEQRKLDQSCDYLEIALRPRRGASYVGSKLFDTWSFRESADSIRGGSHRTAAVGYRSIQLCAGLI